MSSFWNCQCGNTRISRGLRCLNCLCDQVASEIRLGHQGLTADHPLEAALTRIAIALESIAESLAPQTVTGHVDIELTDEALAKIADQPKCSRSKT